MGPYVLAFFLVTAFLVTLIVAIFLIRKMLRERAAQAASPGGSAASQDADVAIEAPVAGSDAKGGREWQRLATGVPRLLELLVAERTLTPEQAAQTMAEQRKNSEGVGPALTRLGFLTEEQLFTWLSRRYGIP